MQAGKTLFPALPLGKRAPWVLLGIALAVLVTGFLIGDTPTMAVGGIGLGALIVAYPLAAFLAPTPAPDEEPQGNAGEPDS